MGVQSIRVFDRKIPANLVTTSELEFVKVTDTLYRVILVIDGKGDQVGFVFGNEDKYYMETLATAKKKAQKVLDQDMCLA